jgi:tol-pal system protein YbgF
MPQASRGTTWARVAVAWLIGVALSACASSSAVRHLGDEARQERARLAELSRAGEELRAEIRTVGTRLDAVRDEVEALRRASEGRERALLDALEGLRARLDDAEQRLAATEAAIAGVERRLAAGEASAASAQERVDALAGAVKTVETTVAGLATQVTRLEALPAPAAVPEPELSAARPPAPGASLTPEQLFGRAMGHFKNGELGQAILDFEDFLAKHRLHALAASAQFWIGEAYFAVRDYQHAAVEYRKVLDLGPQTETASDALFKLGLAYWSLRQPDRAREVWTQLVRDFPQSGAAQKARSALRDASTLPKP